jgi:hypothetical protein
MSPPAWVHETLRLDTRDMVNVNGITFSSDPDENKSVFWGSVEIPVAHKTNKYGLDMCRWTSSTVASCPRLFDRRRQTHRRRAVDCPGSVWMTLLSAQCTYK